jgi:hypothetical protein
MVKDKELEKIIKDRGKGELEDRCGVKVPLSNCCNAPLYYGKGGVKARYCSNCDKEYKEIIIG